VPALPPPLSQLDPAQGAPAGPGIAQGEDLPSDQGDGRGGQDPAQDRPGFGPALAAARLAAGIPSQAALARLAGISQVEANRYERGGRLPSLPRFARLVLLGQLDPAPLLAAIAPLDHP
jgi:hypothetical protein